MITIRRKRPVKLLAILLLALLLPAAVYALFQQRPQAPEVTFTTLDGEKFSTRSMQGKVVWVNFWATNCMACIHEMPDLVRTYEKFKPQGFEVVAVAMSYDPPNYVSNYRQSAKLPFPVMLDSHGDVARAFGNVSLTPTGVLIDKRGRIIRTIVGIPDFEVIHALLEDELAK